MSVITWDHVDNPQTSLTEKQLESVFLLNSLNSTHGEASSDQSDKCQDGNNTPEHLCVHLASHFYSWLSSVEQNLSTETSEVPRKAECLKVLKIVEEILSKLSVLENNYLSISQTTNELHELCEHLLRQQPHFKESPNYLAKVKSALKLALGLIKINVTNTIERTINELLDLHDVISPENSFILLYGRFRSHGPKIRSLMTLLEERVHVTDE
ncbi:unnamed protein product [Trichobilharzia regenti]|nr:unnamed protein product [Trichobilharzia regenti]